MSCSGRSLLVGAEISRKQAGLEAASATTPLQSSARSKQGTSRGVRALTFALVCTGIDLVALHWHRSESSLALASKRNGKAPV